MNSFLEFLQDKHGIQYVGTDDMMPEDFDNWLADQDPLDLIEYAEIWKALVIKSLKTK